LPTNIVEVECPFCHRLVSAQVYPAAAELAAAGDPSEVYERCPKCLRTFALSLPAAPPDSPL
jgi:hypothetical protein